MLSKETPIYKKIYLDLSERISSGMYKPGDRIMTEKEITEAYHVSRITAKKAVEMLVLDGRVVRRPGAGSFVTENVSSDAGNTGRTNAEVVRESSEEDSGQKDIEIEEQLEEAEEKEGLTPEERKACKGKTIGVLFDNFDFAFGCKLLRSITWECERLGIFMYFRCSYENIELEHSYINEFMDIGVSGILVMCVHNDIYDKNILRLVVDEFPVVLLDRDMANVDIPCVTTDNFRAGKAITRLLIDKGNEKIAFVTHGYFTTTINDRIRGMKAALMEKNIAYDDRLCLRGVETCTPSEREEVDEDIYLHDIKLIREFMREHPEVTAYLGGQAGIGRCVLDASRDLENQEKIKVAFFDGPKECFYPKPYCARVIQNEKEMGRMGLLCLVKRMRGEKVPKQILTGFEIVE